jgi:hypothetical protein
VRVPVCAVAAELILVCQSGTRVPRRPGQTAVARASATTRTGKTNHKAADRAGARAMMPVTVTVTGRRAGPFATLPVRQSHHCQWPGPKMPVVPSRSS